MANYDLLPISFSTAPLTVRKIGGIRIDAGDIPVTVTSAVATDSTHVRITFGNPIALTPVLNALATYAITGLVISSVIPEAGLTPSYVDLTTSEQKQGLTYDLIIYDINSVPIEATFTGIGVAPSVVSASMTGNLIYLTFSEEMSSTGLTTTGNYSIPGITVVRVDALSGNTRVAITVTGYLPNTAYTVTVSNLTDKAGNPVA